MLNWHAMPFARILIPFLLGILSLNYFKDLYLIAIFTLFLVFIFAQFYVLFLNKKHKMHWHMLNGVFIFIAVLFTSYIRAWIHEPMNNQNDFSLIKNPKIYELTLSSHISEKSNIFNTYATIERVIDQNNKVHPCQGKILLKIPKSGTLVKPKPGDRYLIQSKLKKIPGPRNPFDFNYQRFLNHKQIHFSTFPANGQFIKLPTTSVSFSRRSNEFRETCLQILKKNIPNQTSLSIIEALLLGYKNDLDNDVTKVFSSTGTMHILAVSGLHTGIFYMILMFVSGRLRFLKYGPLFQTVFVLSGIWAYAYITGLSSSVIRACIMFSMLVIGNISNFNKNTFNSIYASAFLMLLYNPDYIYETGFQLSYAAVLGIVFLHPIIRKQFTPKHKISGYLLDISIVTFAAQIFTFPICLYNFNQFPSYFLFTNVILIPLFTVVLILGIALLFLSWNSMIASFIGKLIDVFLNLNITIMKNSMLLPHALIDNLFLDTFQLITIYLIIFLFIAFLLHKQVYQFFCLLTLILCFLVYKSFNHSVLLQRKQIAIHNIPFTDVITCIEGEQAFIIADSSFIYKNGINRYIKAYLNNMRVTKFNIIESHKSFVSTNICYHPKIGLQFFDQIMTIGNTVHYNIHTPQHHLINGREQNLMQLSITKDIQLIFSNKLSQFNRQKIANIYFINTGILLNVLPEFKEIKIGLK